MKLDDKFHRNPKQLRMSDAAFRLYVRCLSYAADMRAELVTGFLTEAEIAAMGGATKTVTELVGLDAWERVDGGVLIHDFEEYLPKSSTERVRTWRANKRAKAATQAKQAGNAGETVTHIKEERFTPVSETQGNRSSHARGPATRSEPEPVPVIRKAPPIPPTAHADAVKDPATELGVGMHELLGRQISQQDLIECRLALNQYAYLTAADLLDRAGEHLSYCTEHNLPTPRTVAGFADTWRRENDHRADQGAPKANREVNGRTTGMAALADMLPKSKEASQ